MKEGGYAKQLYFVENGYVRSFYRKEDGAEKTHWIYSNDEFVTSWYSFFTEKPSFENLQAISDASVYAISLANYQKLYSECEGFNTFINSNSLTSLVFRLRCEVFTSRSVCMLVPEFGYA